MAFDLGAMLKNVSDLDTGKKQITYIRRDLLDADAGNFYEIRDVGALADNISLVGLQQPILVRFGESAGRYTIVSGHRRMAAITQLAAEDPDKWAEVPCIIEADAVSPALQQLRLVYANANTRQLTAAEIGKQADEVEALLYQLQEEGYEFPGRMRDHVAEIVGVSKSKLARLKVIRSRLIPQFMAKFEAGVLPESTAYTLAQAFDVRQRYIYEQQVKQYGEDFPAPAQSYVENALREMDKALEMCSGLKCPVLQDKNCQHCQMRLQKAAKLHMYNSLPCRGCCRDCTQLPYCADSCEYAGDVKKTQRDKITEANANKKAAEKAEIAKDKALLAASWSRVGALREIKKISPREFVKASLGYAYPDNTSRLPEMETGNVKGNDRMPGGIWPDDARHLIDTAELLGCSVDYLLGRDAPGPSATSCWQTGKPTKVGDYAVIHYFRGARNPPKQVDSAWWNGKAWVMFGMPIDDDVVIHAWVAFPEVTL